MLLYLDQWCCFSGVAGSDVAQGLHIRGPWREWLILWEPHAHTELSSLPDYFSVIFSHNFIRGPVVGLAFLWGSRGTPAFAGK